MATKLVNVEGIGPLTLYKHKKSRSIRISLLHDGRVRVSLPTWLPYQAGINFAISKSDWILKRKRPLQSTLIDGQAVGKAHHLALIPDITTKIISSRLTGVQAVVTYPISLQTDNKQIQAAAQAVSIRALRKQAEQLLPQRLARLANQYGFHYKSVVIRQLKSRWGSCSQHQEITLSLFLMQLPWHLIDYVLLHELIHTTHLHHGPDFWNEFQRVLPGAKQLRHEIRSFRPAIV